MTDGSPNPRRQPPRSLYQSFRSRPQPVRRRVVWGVILVVLTGVIAAGVLYASRENNYDLKRTARCLRKDGFKVRVHLENSAPAPFVGWLTVEQRGFQAETLLFFPTADRASSWVAAQDTSGFGMPTLGNVVFDYEGTLSARDQNKAACLM